MIHDMDKHSQPRSTRFKNAGQWVTFTLTVLVGTSALFTIFLSTTSGQILITNR